MKRGHLDGAFTVQWGKLEVWDAWYLLYNFTRVETAMWFLVMQSCSEGPRLSAGNAVMDHDQRLWVVFDPWLVLVIQYTRIKLLLMKWQQDRDHLLEE